MGEVKKETDSPQWRTVKSQGGNEHKLKYRKPHLNIKNYFYCGGGQTPEQVDQKGSGLLLGGI